MVIAKFEELFAFFSRGCGRVNGFPLQVNAIREVDEQVEERFCQGYDFDDEGGRISRGPESICCNCGQTV